MNSKIKSVVVTLLCGAWVLGLALWGLLLPDGDISLSERRRLAQMPKISAEALLDGSFMSDFESYSADQFPLREGFRRVKSVGEYYVFRRLDSEGIYLKDGYASKLDYPLNTAAAEHVLERMGYIYDTYLKDSGGKIFLSLIPDKNYFMADGYPHLDYDELVAMMRNGAEYAEYIDIFPTLELSDYYRTDTHWRQEKLIDTAKTLADGMGASLTWEYSENELDTPFYGVYYGQSALPLPGERLVYLTSEGLRDIEVYNAELDKTQEVYVMENADGADPYEIFLDGSRSLMVLSNPNADSDKELVIFRDSFGSSIAPLLA